jgi:hypothetical protein
MRWSALETVKSGQPRAAQGRAALRFAFDLAVCIAARTAKRAAKISPPVLVSN